MLTTPCLPASTFDPNRWLDERVKYIVRNPFIFLPFNAGPRICLGQQFAYNKMSYFLIRLLQNFSEVSFAEDEQPSELKPPAAWKSFHDHAHFSPCSARITFSTSATRPRGFLLMKWIAMAGQ